MNDLPACLNHGSKHMKKTTTKKSAPAAKPTVTSKKPAPAPAKTAPKKVAAPAPKPAVAAKAPVAAKPAPAKKAPAVKASTLPVKTTTLSALVDVGFGNTLYLRGDGPGLSWDKGVKLECVSDDCWTIKLGPSTKPIIFKFLLNDVAWSDGNDYIVTPGSSVELKPTFIAG
jgi:hypothetical protein